MSTNGSTEYERKAPIARMCRRYGEIVVDVKGHMWQRARGEADLSSLEGRIHDFKLMLVETSDEHCDLGLYTIKYHLLTHTAENIQRFGTLSHLDISPYDHFHVYMKQAY